MKRSLRFALYLVAAFISALPDAMGSELSESEFFNLPEDARIEVLIAGLKAYQRSISNIIVVTTEEFYNARWSNGNLENPGRRHQRLLQEYRKLDGSYRLDTTNFLYDTKQAIGEQLWTAQSGYDAQTGESRMTARHRDRARPSGRIADRQDTLLNVYHYGYHLGGMVGPTKMSHAVTMLRFIDWYQRNAAQYLKTFSIESGPARDDEEIVIKFHLHYEESNSLQDYVYHVSLAKGFMVTNWERICHPPSADALDKGLTVIDRVASSQKYGDVWLPTHTFYFTRAHDNSSNDLTVWETQVESARFGEVDVAALEVAFVEGMEVHDMHRQVAYVVGGQVLAGPNGPGPIAQSDESMRWWIIGLNAAVLVVISVYWMRRRRSRAAC